MKVSKVAIACLVVFTISCSNKKSRNYNVNIILSEYNTYKYDLRNGLYTVNFSRKPSLTINFQIEKKEIRKIVDDYYDLQIDKISNNIIDTIIIKDECYVSPKFNVVLSVTSKSRNQVIEIDPDCDNFYLSNYKQAENIKKFLKNIRSILRTKNQIRSAPDSDISYE